MENKIKIYVASSWRNEHQPAVVKALREAGFDVYDFKNPAPGDTGFHWSEIDPNWKNWTSEEFIKALKHPIAEAGYAKDMNALESCNVCILVLQSGRSAHLETGWAEGANRVVIAYIPPGVQIEPELMYKMLTHVTTDLQEVIDLIKAASTKEEPEIEES